MSLSRGRLDPLGESETPPTLPFFSCGIFVGMTALDARFVARALGVSPPETNVVFDRVHTDSRTVQKGDLFVAVPGDKFDGNAFVKDALAKGASGVLCRRGAAPADTRAAVFEVEDSLAGFRTLAGKWRDLFAIPVAAVAGAVGKTTTKECLAACLRGRYKSVLRTEGSRNGFVGIPMTLLELRPEHGAAVIEIGIDAPGAMQQHLDLVRPTAATVTAIAEEHLETMKDIETVAREESLAMLWTAKEGGTVAMPADDEYLARHIDQLPADRRYVVRFGGGDRTRAATEINGRYDALSSTISLDGGPENAFEFATFATPLMGAHNARNLALALALARGMGLSIEELKKGMKTFEPPKGRSQVVRLPTEVVILADHYNASPTSVRAGLALFADLAKGISGRRWVCLGDMLELGPHELKYHRDLEDAVLGLNPDGIFLYGPRMRALHEAVSKKGYRGKLVHSEKDIEPLRDALLASVRSGDAVLIKGSRGMRLERLFEELTRVALPRTAAPGIQ